MRYRRFPWLANSVAALVTLVVTACAPKHYSQIQGDSIALYLEDNGAKKVFFASSHDHYKLHPAKRTESNIWKIIVPLKKEFSYFYLVDEILTLPECELTVLDDFGSRNCFFAADL